MADMVPQEVGDFDPGSQAWIELAKRELARRRFLPFVERFNADYDAGWAHKDICERLEQFSKDVHERKSPRLMIFCPPRFGKSVLTSKTFPAWHLGHHPSHEFMCCSYSGALSMSFSRSVRALMREPAYHSLFPETKLDPDSQSVEMWLTTRGGGLVASGVGGAITGKGAHCLIIDDPVKNRDEADSENVRQACWDWYTSTAYTRLSPGGGVLCISTRWHDDDLSGRLLDAMEHGADQWDVVVYEAIASQDEPHRKKGEALHPARYGLDQLQRIRTAIGERDWHALYQQSPVADDGSYFNSTMFPRYSPAELPAVADMNFYTCWDFAIGQKEENDWTVGITAGIDRNHRLWIVDVARGKWDGYQLVRAIIDNYFKWTPMLVGMEKGQILMSINVYLEKEALRREAFGFNPHHITPGRADKVARARGIQGLMQSNQVLFPNAGSTSWVDSLVYEMMRFPSGVWDDQVDAIAYLGYVYNLMVSVPEPREEKKTSWRDRLPQYIEGYEGAGKRWQRS